MQRSRPEPQGVSYAYLTPFGLSLSKPCPSLLLQREREGFDRLSPNGCGSRSLRTDSRAESGEGGLAAASDGFGGLRAAAPPAGRAPTPFAARAALTRWARCRVPSKYYFDGVPLTSDAGL